MELSHSDLRDCRSIRIRHCGGVVILVKGGENFHVPLLFGLYSFKTYKGHKIPEIQFHSSILISVAISEGAPSINADRATPYKLHVQTNHYSSHLGRKYQSSRSITFNVGCSMQMLAALQAEGYGNNVTIAGNSTVRQESEDSIMLRLEVEMRNRHDPAGPQDCWDRHAFSPMAAGKEKHSQGLARGCFPSTGGRSWLIVY